MSSIVFNIAKGAVAAYYDRVKSNDPSTSALILIPIETSGLPADSALIDLDTVTAVLATAANEQTTMGRKTLTDAELATIPAPDDTNDRNERSLPAVTWALASGNPISKVLVAYDAVTGSGTDSDLIPLALIDIGGGSGVTPDGNDVTMAAGTFFRAS